VVGSWEERAVTEKKRRNIRLTDSASYVACIARHAANEATSLNIRHLAEQNGGSQRRDARAARQVYIITVTVAVAVFCFSFFLTSLLSSDNMPDRCSA